MTEIFDSHLPHGMPVTYIHVPGLSSVTALVLIKTGLYAEDVRTNGISHFLEHMCFKGTTTRSGRELMRYLDSLGAETNAFTNEEFTGFYTKGSPDHVSDYLSAVLELFTSPVFPEQDVVTERGVVAGEYDMYEEQPRYQAQKLLSFALFGDQPAGWQIIGSRENIMSFDRDMLVEWHTKWYTTENARMIVAGPLPIKEMVEIGDRAAASVVMRSGERIVRRAVDDIQTEPIFRSVRADTDQTHLCFAFRGIHRLDPRRHVAQVLAGILGAGMSSRLFVRLREDLGAGYYVGAHHIPYSDHGYLEIRCGIEGARTAEIVNEVLAECARLATTSVDPEELLKVQNYLASHARMELESSDAWVEYVGIQKMLDGSYESLDDRIALIRSVTSADIQALAREWLVPRRVTIVGYGQLDVSDIQTGSSEWIASSS